jgi:hypothetical protein
MSEKLKYLPVYFVVAIILIGIALAGCSTGSAGQPVSQEQTVTAPASSNSTNPTPAPATTTQPNSGRQSGSRSGRPGGPDMSKMMSRSAEILGITEAQLTSAYQQAQESVFGKMPSGTPGQRPPTDNTSGHQWTQPPTGTSGQQPPQGGWGPNSETMQKLYSKMAEILNISADKITSAMDQARQELQPAVK